MIKPIPKFKGYLADERGQILSLWARKIIRNEKGQATRTERVISDCPKKLAGAPTKKGYLRVCLMKNGKRFNRFVHLLIAETFFGRKYRGLQTRHLNGNPADNRLSNLKYGTQSENWIDRKRHAVMP